MMLLMAVTSISLEAVLVSHKVVRYGGGRTHAVRRSAYQSHLGLGPAAKHQPYQYVRVRQPW